LTGAFAVKRATLIRAPRSVQATRF